MVVKSLLFLVCVLYGSASVFGARLNTESSELRVQFSALSTRDFYALEQYDVAFAKHNVWDKLKRKILGAWNNLVESAKKTNQSINDWFKNAKSRADEIVAEAKKNIKEKEEEIRVKLKEISDRAKEIGVDVKECTKDQEDEIRHVITSSVANLSRCVIGKVGEAEEIATSIKNIIESSANIRSIIRNRLEECRNSTPAIAVPKCLSSVTGRIIKEVSKISKDIIQSSKRVKDAMEQLKTALPKCAAENSLEISVQFAKVAVNVGKCVKNKMDAANRINNTLIYLLN